uniref:Protein sigma-NS n=1 Tax=Reovirus type 2 (strain D5/Jones) TaxID=10885 RepID=SIGNS_REOVJ|nr:RecName: Full=Protein sigma-NS; Short=SigmaNS [Mammalian orthoreovirus 2 D5/Jones]AAA47282.1 nonstructural protein (sigma-NS) [Mammalian orthoreovirus 2]
MASSLRAAISKIKRDDVGQQVCPNYVMLRSSVNTKVVRNVVDYQIKTGGFFSCIAMLRPLQYAKRERLLGQRNLERIAARDVLQTRDLHSLCMPTPDAPMTNYQASTMRELVCDHFKVDHVDGLRYVPMDDRYSPSSLARLFTMGMAGLHITTEPAYKRVPIMHLAADLDCMTFALPYMITVDGDTVVPVAPTLPAERLLDDGFKGYGCLDISYGCEVDANNRSAGDQSMDSSRCINELYTAETAEAICILKTCLILNCMQFKLEMDDLAHNGFELDKVQMMIPFSERVFRMASAFATIDVQCFRFCLLMKDKNLKIDMRETMRLWTRAGSDDAISTSSLTISLDRGRWVAMDMNEVRLLVFPARV